MRTSHVVIALIIAILVICGALPYIDGCLFKSNFMKLIAIQNQNNAAKINVLDYKQGWFKSFVRVGFTFPQQDIKNAQEAAILNGITVESNVSHGPFVYDKAGSKYTTGLASIDSDLKLPPQITAALQNYLHVSQLVTVSAIAKFGDAWRLHISMPSYKFGNVFVWQGMNADYTLTVKDDAISEITGQGTIGALAYSGVASMPFIPQISVDAISITSDAVKQDVGLWDGQSKISLPSFGLVWRNGKTVVGKTISINTKSMVNVNNYNINEDYSMADLEMPGNTVVQKIAPFNFSVSLNDLNAPALKHLIDQIQAKKAKEEFNDADKQGLVNIMTSASQLNTDLALTTELGAASSKAKVYFVDQPKTFADLQAKVKAEGNARISVPLLTQLIKGYYDKQDTYINAQIKMKAAMNSAATATNAPMQAISSVDTFKEAVAVLVRSNKITLMQSLTILGYEDQHLAPAAFNAKLDASTADKTLAADVADQLKGIYLKQYQSTPVAPQTPTMQLLDSNQQTLEFLNSLMQKGVIIQDQNDYVLNFIFENNVLKVNGKVYDPRTDMPVSQPLPLAPGPALPAAAMPQANAR